MSLPEPADQRAADPVVSLGGVRRTYGSLVAVDALSLTVSRGEMFGIIGPDGAGKTTTLRLMAGLVAPTAGSIEVVGLDPVASHRELTGRVGYLSQRFSLYGDLTIDENVAFVAAIHGLRRYEPERNRLLELTDLAPFRTRLADRLSGGMRQKLALVCTLIHRPSLLLLDEPTTGVDPVSRREFWRLLSALLDDELTIVMATPYLDEAERCTRVALLHEGRVLAVDDPNRLRDAIEGTFLEVVAADASAVMAALADWKDVRDAQLFGDRAHVRLANASGQAAVDSLRSRLGSEGLDVQSVRIVRPSLEDVFIERIYHASSQDCLA